MDVPRVSMILFAYDQAGLVREAALGALAQDYPSLEIILSDDCSPDGSFEIMREAVNGYTGPHDVRLRKSVTNRGFASHFNEALAGASGDLIVLAAGDDVSHPSRVSELVTFWQASGGGTAFLYSDAEGIGLDGRTVEGWHFKGKGPHSIEKMAAGELQILGASSAFTRNLFTAFPPLPQDLVHEDRVLPFRAFLLGGTVSFLDKKLVRYRIVGGVSRHEISDVRHYIDDHLPRAMKRTLPDARLRLAELIASPRDSPDLRQACRGTIINNEAIYDLTRSDNGRRGGALIRNVSKGANIKPLLRLYAKFILLPLINLPVELD